MTELNESNKSSEKEHQSLLQHQVERENDPTLVSDRLDLPADKIGLDPTPPCKIGLKFFQSKGRWSAYILAPAGKLPLVEKWLQAHNPSSCQAAPGIAPRVLRVEFDTLPDRLAYLLNTVHIQNISLYPQGVASVTIRDAHDTIKAFVQTVQSPGENQDAVRTRESRSFEVPDNVQITARQSEALSLAVALGYYEVPHRIGLRELARKMDMSLGALSGLLRRAESTVLHSFADHSVKVEWRNMERQMENMRLTKNDK